MYEELICEAQESGIEVIEMSFKGSLKGLYSQNIIAINSKLEINRLLSSDNKKISSMGI